MKTRFVPVLMLAVLSPLTAEFLLGDQYLQGFMPAGTQIAMLISFVLFYGMAAVLIREIGRRLRIGWPGLMLLALGFGLLEEGLITETLFNPHYLGLSLIAPGHIDLLGIGVPWTMFVLTLHVVWSICTPIAIMEAWATRDGRPDVAPWLGRAAMIICPLLLLVGAAAIGFFTMASSTTRFVAQPGQLIGAAIASALAIAGGLSRRGRQPAQQPGVLADRSRAGRRIAASAVFGLVATTAFQLADHLSNSWAWVSAAAMALVWLAALVIINRFRPEPYAVAIGAVATYAWVGMRPSIAAGTPAVIEQLVLIVIFAALISWVISRIFGRSSATTTAESVTALGQQSRR